MPQARTRTKATSTQQAAAQPLQTTFERPIKIDWQVPPGITTRFVTHFVAQATSPHEVVLSFFEIHPPYIVGTIDEQRAELERLKVIEAECVGRISISSARLEELIELLQKNLLMLAEPSQPETEGK